MTATKLSIAAASRMFDKSRNTIAKDIRNGELSFELGMDGSKNLDFAELRRVYGEPPNPGQGMEAVKQSGSTKAVEPGGDMEAALRQLRDLQDQLKAERERERKQWEAQVDNLQESLKLAQEGQNRITKLLEHHSGGGDWKQAIATMEKRIANQEEASTQQVAEAIKQARSATIREVKGKWFWQIMRMKAE